MDGIDYRKAYKKYKRKYREALHNMELNQRGGDQMCDFPGAISSLSHRKCSKCGGCTYRNLGKGGSTGCVCNDGRD